MRTPRQDACVVVIDHDHFQKIKQIFQAIDGLQFVQRRGIL